jgi:hypothetical protein
MERVNSLWPPLLALLDSLTAWLGDHKWVVWAGMGLSAVLFLATIFLVPWIVVRIPADYLTHNRPPELPWARAHPALRILLVIGKNLLGVFLILLGIVLSLPGIPGPGLLSALIGLALVDIPARRKLMRWAASKDWVFNSINKLRAKHGRPPLEKPDNG